MTNGTKWIRAMAWLLAAMAGSGAARAGEWSKPVEVLHDFQRAIAYRARWSGAYLVVEAAIEPGWHTFAMDNDKRAAEKLAGRPSLGNDLPTEIKVSGGLRVDGPWLQTAPKDFSKPELQWYSFGFENKALFAVKVRRTAGRAQVAIRGQACTEKVCKGIDVEIPVPAGAGGSKGESAGVDLKGLIPVR